MNSTQQEGGSKKVNVNDPYIHNHFVENYARVCRDNEGKIVLQQTLKDHLESVAALAASFAKPFGGSRIAYTTGSVHDLGKDSPDFQEYLFDDDALRGSAPHSIASAKRIYDALHKTSIPLAELIANVVAAHHGWLYDFIAPDGSAVLSEKLRESQNVGERCHYGK